MPQSLADELSSIPMSPNLGQSLERAHRFAREQSHKAVTLEHLLLALTEDAEAALILQSANIELARLATDVSGYLGRLLEDMRSDGTCEPRPDGDLLRVMQAAASAAKQSRRRQIDGAIVLAAIVGDGKSPAAGLLKALGMTFEEAIRALQRANTRARLKPMPKPAPAAPSNPGSIAAEPAPSAGPADPAPPGPETAAAAPPTSPSNSAAAAGVSQSAEEILAAARARIQQRAASAGKVTPPRAVEKPRAEVVPAETRPDEEASLAPEPADAAATDALTEAIEAAMSGSAARASEPAPPPAAPSSPRQPARSAPPQVSPPPPPPAGIAPAPPIAQPSPPAHAPWAPPPEPPRPSPAPAAAQRLPQPPPAPARSQPPLPARLIAPGEGPRRPPLPQSGSPPQPPAGFTNRPPRAPWPEYGEPAIPSRPALANGTYPEASAAPPPVAARAPRPMAKPSPQRTPGHADKGLLIESVPRRMRFGVPANAEVRIARDRIEALIATLSTRGSVPLAEQPLMRALSVRLRAPGADFWIEPATPETQWVDSASSLIHDDYAIWRWTVVARRRGRGRLALMVSARTVGRDGVAAETAPPDRVIEVRIGANWGQTAKRWLGWGLAVLASALLGHFGEQLWMIASLLLTRAL
jgi:hypothetical protein